MSPFAAAVDRVRGDFVSMPRLEVTMGQAVRQWNMGVDDLNDVLETLVDAGFLRWTPKGTLIRAGRRDERGRRVR
ncbi:MAG: hypothetical protein AB7I50_14610 [Vicinamibacterales bacterium]